MKQPIPEVGTVVVDTAREVVAEYRGVSGGRWALRPLDGGLEWEISPESVRVATADEALRARLRAENKRAAWRREVGSA
ncbi:hypothetical protein AB0J38_17455 [Streptomyces sp. NPDC050095]|uniref:hypothetical protein n=1 Tax=unclassified Streptomyces TaxID=2593676 RepID=UPI003429689C